MDIRRLSRLRALLLLVPIFLFSDALSSGSDADQLLKSYVETGLVEYAVQIRDQFPGSPHEKFCDAWEYLDANNEIARKLAAELVNDYPDFAPSHFALGTVLTIGYQEFSDAVSLFDRSIELDPECVLSYRNRGIAKMGLEEYTGAKEDFDHLLTSKRGYAEGFLLRGVANHGLGEEEAMKADFEIGLQLDFQALSRIPGDLAEEAMDKAIESAPDNAIYYYARGYSSFIKGNFRSAGSDFSRCIELVPGSSDFYKYSGASKTQFDDYEGGQKDLNYALSVNPDDPEIYYFLGVLMNDGLKQPTMAREYLDLAIRLDENNELYYYERAKAAFRLMDYEEARSDINRALMLDHRKGDFYALRGNIKMKTGDPPEESCPDFRKAVEWGSSFNLKRIMKKTCNK
jgi:tetratricopeptide (TPR) repeat protein